MAYLRTKTIYGSKYYYLVESKRIDGKPRQKVVKYIGRANVLNSVWGEMLDLMK